jgi:hypothetical protein
MDHYEDLEKARDRSHLVPVKREYTRGGRTYTKTVYIRPEQAEAVKKEGKSTEKPQEEKKSTNGDAKFSKEGKTLLNKTVEDLRKVAPGTSGKIRGISVERHKDGKRFRVGGIVAHGFKAAAMMTAGLERVSATGAQFATGTLRGGEEMARGGQATRDVEALGRKATKTVERAKEALKKKK